MTRPTRPTTSTRAISAVTAVAAAASATLVLGAAPALADAGDVAFALQQGKLVSFAPESPGTLSAPVTLSGIPSGQGILDLATRSTNGALYALTGPSGFGASGPESLYVIDTTTGAATLASTLSVDLPSNQYAIAFNPTVDRLRIVGVTSTDDYRVNVDTGAVTVDGSLAYAPGDPNNGTTPRITGVGYTGAPLGGATALYDYDLRDALSANPARVLAQQKPANDGTLLTVGTIDATTTGFGQDFTTGRLGGAEVGYLTGSEGDLNQSVLYRVELGSGKSTRLGLVGARIANGAVGGIAIRRAAAAPAPVVPEFPLSALALVAGLGVAATVIVRRRRSAGSTA